MLHRTSPHVRTPGTAGATASVGILTAVLLYAAFASFWILLSDRAMQLLFTDPDRLALASTFKGLAFVVVTSLLLYGLMRRLLERTGEAPATATNLRPLALPLGFLALAILAMTGGAIVHTVLHQKSKEAAKLQTIADLKVRQIEDWLEERNQDARFVQTNPVWFDLYRHWREDGDPASRDLLQARLKRFLSHSFFQAAVVLDEQDEPFWSTESTPSTLDSALRDGVRRAARKQDVLHLGPYRDAAGRLHLDFIVPLPAGDGRPGPSIILRVDPTEYLFRVLETWPVPSASSETLLFRRDGDHVLYLNALRHSPDAAAKLRLSAAAEDLPAARILRQQAKEGELVEGTDYRGVPVMGVARAVGGTDWLLATKMDKSEFYAEAAGDTLWIALAGLMCLFMAATSVFIFHQRQELVASLREREIHAEKLRALQLLDAISEGSADAIFAKDKEGRYLLFNREAARITGKEVQEVLGRDDTAVFPSEQAALIRENDRQVMIENRSVTFQEDLTTIEGEANFLATKGPLRDASGNVIGLFGISRDITERKRAETALRDSLEEKVVLLKEVHHRVKNNLQVVASLLSLQASRAHSREVVEVLHDTRNRVCSMGLLHEVLYRSGNLARINFAAYVRELCTQLLRSYVPASARVKVESRVAPIRLALEQAVPCGLIVSELVSNALKHGFPEERCGRVMVELQCEEEQRLTMRVSDDGVGLPPGFDPAVTGTLGLKLVSKLAGQLGGELAVERPPDGAAFTVVFPLPKDTSPRGDS